MQRFVLDSSVILKWLDQKNEERVRESEVLLKELVVNKIEVRVPELAKYEIGNTLLLKKQLTFDQVWEVFNFLYGLPIKFISETKELAGLTYKFGQEWKMTYYDAAFVALAKLTGATLVTDNPKHQAQVKGVKVIALENYK